VEQAMKRKFNSDEKEKLLKDAKGKCCCCGKKLGKDWHADHVVPVSNGGNTVLTNGQALCKMCNLKKGFKDLEE
jgi:5-methylcytosine-specific restriction endonuclease McrA